MPAARRCRLRAMEDVAARALAQSVLWVDPASGGFRLHRAGHALLPPDDRAALRLRQSRPRCQSAADLLPIYAVMQKMGPEIEFQTLHTTPEDFEGTIKKGVSLGAGS